ncbi:MAG TPA: KamA family radical SAM protein [Candidatus Latescibacteria bacterium]|nr:lysine 2,3-aminomutase [Gemmatimonadota bacterium]HCR18303.1 KamA family radical SAM protein [Candidatus Latescibacterota bacterium]|tara:strand:- start:920 stop:2290 length:1371 start_codon:yes stop_codon:yes gene_type:complete
MELAELERDNTDELNDPSAMAHRSLRRDPFWKSIPAYEQVDEETFHSHLFQTRNAITSVEKLKDALGDLADSDFYEDLRQGLHHAPMSIRISPYIVSLINWEDPFSDPLRTQFLPLGSQQLPDHPELHLDSLNEQADSPVPGLTHRYPDRALFLTLDTCPVYCRFCTRSYAVGLDTDEVEKVHMSANRKRWDEVFSYVASRPELEDIVISGGDVYNLRAEQIRYIGEQLLAIDHIRRFRFASKGPAVMPGKLLTDPEWSSALVGVVEKGREMHKEVVLHTHFNHPNEITGKTKDAMDYLMERGVTVRNQAVLQRGVNDNIETMKLLVKRLSYVNVQPYYVFFHDLVQGVEDLRTTLESGLEIEKALRGTTSGFNTPTFIVDTFGGGGKRDAHSFELYNQEAGIGVFASPTVRPGQYFYYFDPIDCLADEVQERWKDDDLRRKIMAEALDMVNQNSR